MKYFSEMLNKFFDEEKELTEAEANYEKLQQEKEEEKAKEKQNKKLMAQAIEEADKEIDEAQENYIRATKEAKELIKQSTEEADKKLIIPAQERLKDARQKRYDAIKQFNEKYGPYSVTYTGNKAYTEFKRNYDFINQFFDNFFLW